MPSTTSKLGRSARYWVFGVLVLAGVWRAVQASALPVISRDGVVFCWYARALGEHGLAYLRSPDAQQHPLFPALILAVQRAATALGAPDTPLTWQHSGQLVAWLAGMGVVILAGVLARRLVRRLELPLSEHATMISAMLLAALLDRNVWLSADVMSDQVHLLFYLAAVWLLLKLDGLRAALGCGLLAGFAFLTRQEGALPVVAGLTVLLAQWKQIAARKLTARAVCLLLGFVICAGPYWSLVGRFSTKKDPATWFAEEAVAAIWPASIPINEPTLTARDEITPDSDLRLARLKTLDLPWYKVLPFALEKLFRAGRVVIILLAVLPLLNLRKRLLKPPLIGLTTCLVGHFALTLILLHRYGYLAPRHTLVIVLLLIPLAAMLLGRVLYLTQQPGRRWLGAMIWAVCLLPLAMYSVRVPNSKDLFVRDATRWLVAHDPAVGTKRLLGGASTRRIAFYADMQWESWPETPHEYDALCAQVLAPTPGYFVIEFEASASTVDQDERAGNRALVARLLADERIKPRLQRVHVQPGPEGSALHVFELRPEPA